MPNVTTTYERWLNRNKSKMDSWLRGTDPGTIKKNREFNQRIKSRRGMQKKQLDRALKRIQKQKGISRLKAMKYLRQQTAKGKKISQLGRSGG